MDVVIIGAGGHGKVVLDILRAAGKHKPVGFIDANPSLAGSSIGGLPVLGQANFLPKLKSQKIRGAIIAIGENRIRRQYARMTEEHGFELVNAVHPASIVSSGAKLGKNVVVAAGAIVGTESRVHDLAIINSAAIVEHECEIGEAAHICPGAALAGRVRIGAQSFIGLGCRIIQCVKIGERAVVGAGAVVLSDVPDDVTVVGVPARVIKIARPIAEAVPA